MLKIFTYQDRDVLGVPGAPGVPGVLAAPDALAGLTWALKRQAGLFGRTPLALTWADRIALVPEEAEYIGKASLLSLLIGGFGEEDRKARVIVAFTDDPAADAAQGLFFAAVVVNGKPAIGAERLFATREELLTHIEVECSTGQIDRLATTADLAAEIHSPVPVSYLGGAASGPTSKPVRVEGKLTPQLPIWQIAAAGGASVLALTAGVLFLFPVQQSKPAAPLPMAAVQLTVRDEAAFANNCLAAFAGAWPIAPGWQLVSEGCATPEMRDTAIADLAGHAVSAGSVGLAPAHAVAYRIWQLRGGFDAAIARKAAEAVYAGSATAATRAVHMEIRGNRLFSSLEIAAPMRNLADATASEPSTDPLTPAALLAATEAVFLGLADSIVLQDGSSPGGGSGKVRVTLKSSFEEIFARMQRIDGAEIARLTRSGNIVTLEITPRQIVTVPVLLTAATQTARTGAPRAATGEIAAKTAATQKDEAL